MGHTGGEWYDGYTSSENAAKWNSHIRESKDPFRLNPGGLYDQIRIWAEMHGLTAQGGDVLDVCCGQGVTSEVIAQATGGIVTGVDLSQPLIQTARVNYSSRSDLVFMEGDASDLSGFSDKQFAAATMINGLFHLPPDVMVKAVSELSRVSRGPVLITTVNPVAYEDFASAFHNPVRYEIEHAGLERTTVVFGNPEIAGPGDSRIILEGTPFVMHTDNNIVKALSGANLRFYSARRFGPLSDVGGRDVDLFVAMDLVHIR